SAARLYRATLRSAGSRRSDSRDRAPGSARPERAPRPGSAPARPPGRSRRRRRPPRRRIRAWLREAVREGSSRRAARRRHVASVRAGAVTLVDTATLRVRRVLRGFASPHIPACSLDGRYIYVTDDARGQLTVIRSRVVRKLFVGFGAHHIAVSPDQPRLWIAL